MATHVRVRRWAEWQYVSNYCLFKQKTLAILLTYNYELCFRHDYSCYFICCFSHLSETTSRWLVPRFQHNALKVTTHLWARYDMDCELTPISTHKRTQASPLLRSKSDEKETNQIDCYSKGCDACRYSKECGVYCSLSRRWTSRDWDVIRARPCRNLLKKKKRKASELQ